MGLNDIIINRDNNYNMKYLLYEIFSGVGFYNQLFSLETAIYLANISGRKLVLFIKFPLCHCGKSSWNYGTLMNFFNDDYKQFLPNGIEIYYGNIPEKYTTIIKNSEITDKISFGTRFSQIGFIDIELFSLYNNDINNINIRNFLHGRKPILLDINTWTSEYIYLTESNASRCFSNFLTSTHNYQIMSNICESLTHLHDSFYYISKQFTLPSNYIAIHFRFGDSRLDTNVVNNRCSTDTSVLFKTINKYSAYNKDIIIMADRKDTKFLGTICNEYSSSITYSEDIVNNVTINEHFSNILDDRVIKFLLQKYVCEKANVFIGYEGSTVSNHIQYMNYLNNKSYIHYVNKDIVLADGYSWKNNGIPGGGIGWKLFFSDNIYKSKLKIITLTNDGYMNLTENLLISMRKLGIEKMLKIYCIGQKSYNYFKNNYYHNEIVQIDSDEEYLSTWVEYKAQQTKDIEGKKQWATITSYKIYAINKELLRDNDVIFIDGDIVFEKDPFKYMLESLEPDTELLIQNDQQKDMIPAMCTGFFWMKSNKNTKEITNFDTIMKNIDSFQNDQQYMRRFAKRIVHKYLDLGHFPNGKYFRENVKEIEPYIIHFNYDVSQHKIRRMKQFNRWYLDSEQVKENVFEIPKMISSTVQKSNDINSIYKINDCNSICQFLETRNIKIKQGYITQVEEHAKQLMTHLNTICDVNNIENVLEIGFLAGHSAEMFLKMNKNIKVTSIDEGVLQSVKSGKEYIDLFYPNRHTLIKGNSNNILKGDTFTESQNKYDIILIDGSFKYDVMKQDILLSKKLADEKTIVIINGVVENKKMIKYWNADAVLIAKEMIDNSFMDKLIQFDIDVGRGSLLCKYKIND